MKINQLSIVIPILNEEKNLINLVNQIKIVIKKIKLRKLELIFIDDNSKDKTEQILKNLAKKNKFVKYFIRKKNNPDLSKSCIEGFKRSKYDNILVMDGDLQHPPRFINHMTKIYFNKNVDIVVGSRNLLKKKDPGLGLFRYISSLTIIYLINLLLENKTSDPLSGFFIFKKKIFLKNKSRLFGNGYKILADLIYSSKGKLNILDQNIYFDTRKKGKSKMNLNVLIQLILFIMKSYFSKWKN